MAKLVPVVSAYRRSGSGGIGGTGRKTSWWEVTLACGHVMERGHGKRPAPKHSHCDHGCRTWPGQRDPKHDAARYRWLRDHCTLVVTDTRSTLPGTLLDIRAQSWTKCADAKILDEAIDAAAKTEQNREVGENG